MGDAETGRLALRNAPDGMAVTVTVAELRRLPADRTRAYLAGKVARRLHAERTGAAPPASVAPTPRLRGPVWPDDGTYTRLRALLERRETTVRELAVVSGVHENTIYRLNRPGARLSLESATALSAALGVTVEWLTQGDEVG